LPSGDHINARTTIVTVAYNSAAVIDEMLSSIPEWTPVVVVNNGSKDGIAQIVAKYQNCSLMSLQTNQGFGRACNAGAANVTTEFLMFLNPDARVLPDAIETLEDFADQHPQLGAANPAISDAKGRVRLKMSSPLPVPTMQRPALDEAGPMPVLSGGALFVRRAAFEAVGGFDPAIFLYHEDHDLCLRLVHAGFVLWHVPQAKAVHVAGTGSARTAEMAAWKGYQMARSRVYVLNQAVPKSGFRRTFWPAVIGLLGPSNLLSKRRRAKYLGQIKGAFSARQDGGRYTG
jgi:N-acetylglucosaminyl-diphospho-decaprenol L-rhamnosyltransferase